MVNDKDITADCDYFRRSDLLLHESSYPRALDTPQLQATRAPLDCRRQLPSVEKRHTGFTRLVNPTIGSLLVEATSSLPKPFRCFSER